MKHIFKRIVGFTYFLVLLGLIADDFYCIFLYWTGDLTYQEVVSWSVLRILMALCVLSNFSVFCPSVARSKFRWALVPGNIFLCATGIWGISEQLQKYETIVPLVNKLIKLDLVIWTSVFNVVCALGALGWLFYARYRTPGAWGDLD